MVRAEQRQELRLLEHRASEGPERRLGWKGCFLMTWVVALLLTRAALVS